LWTDCKNSFDKLKIDQYCKKKKLKKVVIVSKLLQKIILINFRSHKLFKIITNFSILCWVTDENETEKIFHKIIGR